MKMPEAWRDHQEVPPRSLRPRGEMSPVEITMVIYRFQSAFRNPKFPRRLIPFNPQSEIRNPIAASLLSFRHPQAASSTPWLSATLWLSILTSHARVVTATVTGDMQFASQAPVFRAPPSLHLSQLDVQHPLDALHDIPPCPGLLSLCDSSHRRLANSNHLAAVTSATGIEPENN